ncbi:MAG TPA: methylated-DNA--[protein]-cysteine S-methyltransferase [Candidatus Babeliales bacterium]|nr:methylated-DNA--[protein]-cysteine S-methyltransferase [Candidatus Babeliales bacterium]
MITEKMKQEFYSALHEIPYDQTKSYADQANIIGNKFACRAVANANGANQIAIVIPCRRIINSNGDIGGYGGGIARKKMAS